jgi:hypothetical protein
MLKISLSDGLHSSGTIDTSVPEAPFFTKPERKHMRPTFLYEAPRNEFPTSLQPLLNINGSADVE